MHEILIDNILIKYKIDFKRNKNTYFYFKKPGYIQINASKHQKKKDILKYMENNSQAFTKKYKKLIESEAYDESYKIWGTEYNIVKDESLKKVKFNHIEKVVMEPNFVIDQLDNYYKIEEKKILLKEAIELKDNYLKNGLIDISNIKIGTRSSSTRFGSCNFRLMKINLNLELVHYDKKYIEYVFLHEIAHLIHQNHSQDFYLLLEKLSPNHKKLKTELNYIFRR